jgi:regulator of protease activity HflC (stomatin/prohibitin superfamily)
MSLIVFIIDHVASLFPLAILLLWISTSFVVVRQQTAAIVENFGRYAGTKDAGLALKAPWPIGHVVARIPLQLQQINHDVEVKTRDNAFVAFPVSVQYRVTDARKAHYELDRPQTQILSYVLNSVRSETSMVDFDNLYAQKNEIAKKVTETLKQEMAAFGFEIVGVLVDQPIPDKSVRDAYNRVIASMREREAAENEAKATKIRILGVAEAESESKRLQGEGIAKQRAAIANGLKDAVEKLKTCTRLDEASIMAMLMMTNQYDTIREAAQGPATLILMQSGGDKAIEDIGRMAAAFRAVGSEKLLSGSGADKRKPETAKTEIGAEPRRNAEQTKSSDKKTSGEVGKATTQKS